MRDILRKDLLGIRMMGGDGHLVRPVFCAALSNVRKGHLSRTPRAKRKPAPNPTGRTRACLNLAARTQPRSLRCAQPSVYHQPWITSFPMGRLPARRRVIRGRPGFALPADRHRRTRERFRHRPARHAPPRPPRPKGCFRSGPTAAVMPCTNYCADRKGKIKSFLRISSRRQGSAVGDLRDAERQRPEAQARASLAPVERAPFAGEALACASGSDWRPLTIERSIERMSTLACSTAGEAPAATRSAARATRNHQSPPQIACRPKPPPAA
jgi:hypothetical protein